MTTGTIASEFAPPAAPAPLTPDALRVVDLPTPYLVTDLDTVAERYAGFTAALPGVATFYAMKCNPAPEILRTLADQGAGFEVASIGELRMLQALGVDPATVLYSNPVKPPGQIAAAAGMGLWRFSFDSPNELAKIAEKAPGSAVYVRLRVDDSNSMFPLSRKFGTDVEDAYDLMLLARRLGLRPYGVTFHVGSQCGSTSAWQSAIRLAGELMERLRGDGIELEMLDLGGGFPARYRAGVPSIEEIGAVVQDALAELPYRPALIAAEPGRHLVAEAAVMAATVIGREMRGDENWLFVEVSTYHGLMEALQTAGGWDFPVWSSVPELPGTETLPFTITGPTCDSSDTIGYGIPLPATVTVGDVVYFGSAGAYSLSYATAFNGFQPPTPVFVGTGQPRARR
ncbi:type III PLP-dependent enzyme [Paractinoplanes rishiriensis]|uniref:ornithine decarboxylase n=1 Tax=Paractinoplanes rishiriensis TaxID=1050105 RepID=A0A919MZ09_9ACTN|nr:type III PLP-dependent enzyme [Actinoplanes rishiriensis]GIE93202.1 ornithine decarboxylase [Actinoplanes rishiriensis]